MKLYKSNKEIIEEFGENCSPFFYIDQGRKQARRELNYFEKKVKISLLKKQIKILNDMDRDTLDLYELKQMLLEIQREL